MKTLDRSKSQQGQSKRSRTILGLENNSMNLKGVGVGLEHNNYIHLVDNFICILQNCRKKKDLDYAKHVHAHICKNGLEAHRAVGNYIVPVFVECGSLLDAHQVFKTLVHRNEYSWTSLILGYIDCGKSELALNLYQKMQEDGVHPSSFTLLPLLKACASLKNMKRGHEIHIAITQKGFERDLVVCSTLVGMYAKCGSLLEAQEVFDKVPAQDVVLWTALIAGYVEHEFGQEAVKCFKRMHEEGVFSNDVTFIWLFKACCSMRAIDKGREIHAQLLQNGIKIDLILGSSLIDMYSKCGSLLEACEVFKNLQVRDVVSWNALIAGYAGHGPGQEALKCFERMQVEGTSPDAVTFVGVLKACSSIGALEKGQQIHMEILQKGFEREIFVGNTLIDMYANCGSLSEAQKVLTNLPVRDVVSWNALIAGYVEHGFGMEVLNFFEQMQSERVIPNVVTFVCILKACENMGAIDKGRKLHREITQKGFDRGLSVGSSLVGMYAKCGSISEAQEVFAKLPARDVVSWNALITEYTEHELGLDALECFKQMQVERISPNSVTFVCVLKACANIGAIDNGREIHIEMTQKGIERDPFVGNTLVDMYAKCGLLSDAGSVFNSLSVQDVVSWSARIAGYTINHDDDMALQCFQEMLKQGVKPNSVTFTSLLTACSHASLVFRAQEYFKAMREEFGISPTVDHFTCMVDLVARSGHLYEAQRFLETIPCSLSEETWKALLSLCKAYGEVTIGVHCFQQLVQIKPEDGASYVLMADIYANADRLDDAHRMEELRKYAGAKKKAATALIEVNKKVQEFVVGNNQSKEIKALVEILSSHMKDKGHVPNLDLVETHN